ncbi:hypothetical protein [Streptomyces sp. 35G-GA-8]|uniref:hypothetical protein n=1 Tax=Streptomyces sp. 35G-GA-8 TaxID=2939434 RepID=UPI00201F8878|nr:hypothetical protein [Streptomyces sp. 35G-GA-8]MCL7380804.1 hypothetical protein [Streptomyces sp. 35G-GA-8]
MGIRNAETSRIRPLAIVALAGCLLAGGTVAASAGGAFDTSNRAGAKADDTVSMAGAGRQQGSAATAKKCQGSAIGLPGKWVTGQSECAFIGSKTTKSLTYELWGDKYAGQQRAVVEVFGVSPQGKGTWYKAGGVAGGVSTTTRISVPWGNSAATPKIRVMSTSPAALMAKVNFSH